MRKKIFDDKFNMPTRLDVGTAEKDVTEPTETPYPLAKGSDGLPKFNQLQEAQKKNLPKALRTQVAFQQKKLQYSNYQIVNFEIDPTTDTTSQAYYYSNFNQAVAVGTAMTDGVLFGSNTKSSDKAKYYNIVYANARFKSATADTNDAIINPSFIEFYLMQKVAGGVFGGKIPRQVEAVKDETNLESLTVTGAEYGVQSFGLDIYNENVIYSQNKEIRGMRCCGIALKLIDLNFGVALNISGIRLIVELGIDLTTVGNNY